MLSGSSAEQAVPAPRRTSRTAPPATGPPRPPRPSPRPGGRSPRRSAGPPRAARRRAACRPVARWIRLHQRHRRGRVGRLGQVVRHVHGEAERRAVVFAEPQLEQAGRAARHLQPVHQRPVALGQLGLGGVRGDPERPRVRHAHRDAVETDRQPHAKLRGQPPDRTGEAAPTGDPAQARSGGGTAPRQCHEEGIRLAPARRTTPSDPSRRPSPGAGTGNRSARPHRTPRPAGDRAC